MHNIGAFDNWKRSAALDRVRKWALKMVAKIIWTDEMLAVLCARAAEKWSGSMIAREINTKFGTDLSRSAVLGKAYRAKISLIGMAQMREPRPYRRTPGSLYSGFDAQGRARKKQWVIKPFVPQCDVVEASQPVTLRELEEHQCHWPLLNHSTSGEQLYCGAPKLHGCYCTTHLQAKNKSRVAA